MRFPLPILLLLLSAVVSVFSLSSCQLLGNNCIEATDESGLCAADDDDSGDDDDDSSHTADDDDSGGSDISDDDDDVEQEEITAVTFAAVLEGTAHPESADGAEFTMLTGTFQFLYWGNLEDQRLVCRQRYQVEASALFGQAQLAPCPGCGGQVTIMSAQIDEADEDACPKLSPETDLAFLLDQQDIAVPADFRKLSLVSVPDLVETDWPLSLSGLPMRDVIESYDAAGLTAYWIGMVEAGGWLGQEAQLSAVAAPWKATSPLLPMFVLYRDSSQINQSWDMTGDCFLSTLWTVRVGSGMGATQLP